MPVSASWRATFGAAPAMTSLLLPSPHQVGPMAFSSPRARGGFKTPSLPAGAKAASPRRPSVRHEGVCEDRVEGVAVLARSTYEGGCVFQSDGRGRPRSEECRV